MSMFCIVWIIGNNYCMLTVLYAEKKTQTLFMQCAEQMDRPININWRFKKMKICLNNIRNSFLPCLFIYSFLSLSPFLSSSFFLLFFPSPSLPSHPLPFPFTSFSPPLSFLSFSLKYLVVLSACFQFSAQKSLLLVLVRASVAGDQTGVARLQAKQATPL